MERPKVGHTRVRETGEGPENSPSHSVHRSRRSHVEKPKLAGGVPLREKAEIGEKQGETKVSSNPFHASPTRLPPPAHTSGGVPCVPLPQATCSQSVYFSGGDTSYLPCVSTGRQIVGGEGPQSQLLDHLALLRVDQSLLIQGLPTPLLLVEVTWVVPRCPVYFLAPWGTQSEGKEAALSVPDLTKYIISVSIKVPV